MSEGEQWDSVASAFVDGPCGDTINEADILATGGNGEMLGGTALGMILGHDQALNGSGNGHLPSPPTANANVIFSQKMTSDTPMTSFHLRSC